MDASFCQSDSDVHDQNSFIESNIILTTSLDDFFWPCIVMTSSQASEVPALYINPKFSLVFFKAESFLVNFNSEKQKKIVSRDFLKQVNIKESVYINLSPEMQSSIHKQSDGKLHYPRPV